MEEVVWTEAFSVGVPLLDQQHQKLVELINRLLAFDDADASESYHNVLYDLLSFAKLHFQTEETLMRMHRYPGLAAQVEEHAGYLDKLKDFGADVRDGVIDVRGLNVYLRAWWIEHIVESDMAYRPFFVQIKMHV